MRQILDAVKIPCTYSTLLDNLSNTWNCPQEQFKNSVYKFMKRMSKLGVVIPEAQLVQEDNHVAVKVHSVIDGYELLEEIVNNHKVEIYKCINQSNNTFYTLKLLGVHELEKSRDRFLREFTILESLPAHKNVRQCITRGQYGNSPYIIFEYIDGKPISYYIQVFSLAKKLSVGLQMLEAVEHLHRNDIMHGDIHIGNFLIDTADTVKLIDLGLAFSRQEAVVKHGGVARYMPPERMPDDNLFFSHKTGTCVSEVFQMGVCLYLLLSGEMPFHGTYLKDLVQSIKYNEPLPLLCSAIGENISSDIHKIIFKSLQKDPAARYQSLTEMIHDWKKLTDIYSYDVLRN